MARPSKPMAKNSNSKFTTRNNKQDIFSTIAKASKLKEESHKSTIGSSKPNVDNSKP